MSKFKYITFIIILFFTFISPVKALDIQYGSINGYKGSNVLVEYYGLGVKKYYLCNILSYKCSITKKTMLSISRAPILKTSIKKLIEDKNAGRITLSNKEQWLAYYDKAKEPEYTRIYTIKNTKSNATYTTSSKIDYWDLVNEQKKVFEFSPDEKTLLYLDDKDGFMSLYKVDLNSLKDGRIESTKLNTSAYTINSFIYNDSSNIYYIGNNKDNPYKWYLYHFNLVTNKEDVIESYVSYVDPILKIGSVLIFNRLQEKGYGPEIYNIKTKKIAYLKIPNISTKIVIKNEEYVKIGNSNAVIMTPLTYNPTKTYPALIWIHGGPLRQTSLGYHPYHSYGIYDATLKLLQKNNVIVLKLGYRGSFGNGRNYSDGIKDNVGSGDIDDVMEAVNYLHNQYHINDVYLSGNSYGGYMSLKAVVEHPESFKSIFSINGVTDWESLLAEMKTSIFNTDFNGLPDSMNKNLYEQASIINKINNLGNQGIEIIQGGADRTIPPWQSILLYKKLKEANKNVNLVTYKGEDHVFKLKKNIDDICVRLFGMIGIKNTKECIK